MIDIKSSKKSFTIGVRNIHKSLIGRLTLRLRYLKNVHRFVLSELRGELLERERER